jgi:hypothetical protein
MGIGFYRNHLFLFQTSYGVNNSPVVSKEDRMDWATFFEKYSDSLFALAGVFIGTAASLIGLVIGYYFQKWSDERKRVWELQDRQGKRLLELRDTKIAEAQECLNRYMNASSKLANIEVETMFSKDVSTFRAKLETVLQEMRLTTSTLTSMNFLNDSELNSFEQQLTSLIWTEQENALNLVKAIANEETLDEHAIRTRLLEFSGKAGELSRKIQKKLDTFSEAIL